MENTTNASTAELSPPPHISVALAHPATFTCDALVIGITSDEPHFTQAAAEIDRHLTGQLSRLKEAGEIKGAAHEILLLHSLEKINPARVLVIGLGKSAQITPDKLRLASAVACRKLCQIGVSAIGMSLHTTPQVAPRAAAQAVVEGALLGLYSFQKYLSKRENTNHIKSLTLLTGEDTPRADIEQGIEAGKIMGEATNFARTLINEPPNVLTPTYLAKQAQEMAQAYELECEILGREQMQQLGMGALLGVAQGSDQPPQLIVLRYYGAGKDQKGGLGLVGKGVTFDSGGISIKPAERMDEMKTDMSGAAAVIGAMLAIAMLKPAINVTALAPTSENMPGGRAYRPGDILRAMNGKSIEILNTDAEGRLLLADALAYARTLELDPIIDVATLTGACVVALGQICSGVFSNNETLTQQILEASKTSGEKLWPMPMFDEYDELIKSEIADVRQTGGRYGGAITAAKFLSRFAEGARWAHLDIAGTAYLEKKPSMDKGATGVTVRTLATLALQLANPTVS